ncbi:MAG: excinuclease ABC subunit UvrA [Candidatus Omnitrophota bacterium]
MDYITIKGAREHNLKNINVRLPRHSFIVITGLSGSGKSSLAFDTIYAEGQRRYLESFSSYSRQFLEKVKKADVDYISGLSPAISIEQRQISKNPRSTVGTVTEIYDYLRLLYAKVGDVFCFKCGRKVEHQTRDEIFRAAINIGKGKPISIYAPMVRGRKGIYKDFIAGIRKKGFTKVKIDGTLYDVNNKITIKKNVRHSIEVLIDRVIIEIQSEKRISDSLNTALNMAGGLCVIQEERGRKQLMFSETMSCPECAVSYSEFTPNMFSFNSPYGACTVCHGLGKVSNIVSTLVIKDESKPLLRGALNPDLFFSYNKYFIEDLVTELMDSYTFDLSTPYSDLSDEVKDAFFWGNDDVDGLFDELRDQMNKTSSENIRNKLRKFIDENICPRCKGTRLKDESRGVKLKGIHIADLCALSIDKVKRFFDHLQLTAQKRSIAEPILKEIRERLKFLVNVGVGYLSVDRRIATLGGGEMQRIKIGAQVGIGLSGVLYVLDEPSIGLHPHDNHKLLNTLLVLRDLRNTVIVVEHDEETIRKADFVVDLGPGAGEQGGKIIGKGTMKQFMKSPRSLTAQYLRHEMQIDIPQYRKPYKKGEWIVITKASEHNLKEIDVKIPLGLFTCITGVSGSGKSSLIHDTLSVALHNKRWKTHYAVGRHEAISGDEHINNVIEIDQSSIGRTPRSNPATYIDLFVHIRKLFASLPDARLRSYSPGRFSFNVKGGRCEACQGAGVKKLTMSFMPDIYVVCEICNGKRYNDQTLTITYKNKNISEVLNMSVREALEFFSSIPLVREKLAALDKVGLAYIKLGQSSTTLSGGEAQRVKLAAELAKKHEERTLYLLDEPTTGLHFHDIKNLLKALLKLRDSGNTVVVIEHNLDVIKMADYIIDLGPGGGEAGGYIVAQGTPEEIVRATRSYTGKYLKNYLNL